MTLLPTTASGTERAEKPAPITDSRAPPMRSHKGYPTHSGTAAPALLCRPGASLALKLAHRAGGRHNSQVIWRHVALPLASASRLACAAPRSSLSVALDLSVTHFDVLHPRGLLAPCLLLLERCTPSTSTLTLDSGSAQLTNGRPLRRGALGYTAATCTHPYPLSQGLILA